MEIQILDESTIDRIAAGEVVDRPASVVKELVENSLDAGADGITVEIKEGGMSLIRVTDNGTGIPKEQTAKAFLRHATSKIRTSTDLLRLHSLGFRGEALSSICAVAQVEMITKEPEALTGLRYVIDGGTEKGKEEIGAPRGTTMLVRNLFYNVPARKKFLKTAQTEGGYITDLMEHLALSRPEVSFKYVMNGQVKFHTSGDGNLKEIVYRIYGRDIVRELLWLEKESGGFRLSGLIGTPVIGRASRNFENFFVNGRFVKSPVAARAAEEAYKPWLMQHRFPFFVLHITMDPDMLDVNVHPSKMEVRFHGEQAVSDFIYGAVKDTLSEKEMLKQIRIGEKGEKEKGVKEEKRAVHVPEPFETEARKRQEGGNAGPADMPVPGPLRTAEEAVYTWQGNVKRLPGGGKSGSNIIKKDEHILVERPMQMNLFEEKLIDSSLREEYRILGQAFGTYWIVQIRDKILFIDQHAAHEKVKYERLVKQIREGSTGSQQVNPPAILSMSGKEESVYREYESYFRQLGFEIEPFGGSEYAIRGVPVELFGHPARELLTDVLDELAEGPLRGEPDIIAEKLASMSCKAAVKGNHTMSRKEAESLIDELLTLENPYHCPHGRPTVITMSRHELEKRFSRIV